MEEAAEEEELDVRGFEKRRPGVSRECRNAGLSLERSSFQLPERCCMNRSPGANFIEPECVS